jgi:hypothetical protein
MKDMLVFENKAIDTLRLVAKKGKYVIAIGLHYAASEGDFYLEIEDSEKGISDYFIFEKFEDVINFVEERYGKTNLREFLQEANKQQVLIYKSKYVRKAKGVKNKKDIYNRLSHIAKEEIDKILFS